MVLQIATVNIRGNIVEAGYVGCFTNLLLSPINEIVDFIIDSLDGMNITECPSMDVCASQPCINGRTCVQVDKRFACLCPNHYTGIICEVLICSENLPEWRNMYC